MYDFGFLVIRCPTCGNDLVYSPIPSLYFCLELMIGENIGINLKCNPWIPEDAPVEDLLKLTDRIEKLAPNIIQRQSQDYSQTRFREGQREQLDYHTGHPKNPMSDKRSQTSSRS